jgi:hypothetical protein
MATKIREASFALQIVRRRTGDAAIIYRRSLDEKRRERLTRISGISPLAFSSGASLLRTAVRESTPTENKPPALVPGPFIPLDSDWGAKVAVYAMVASGLRNADRMNHASLNLRESDGAEAAWWFGVLQNGTRNRARRALRILLEAVS